jgi:aminoglycoside/choline kinase family phosphotransferase
MRPAAPPAADGPQSLVLMQSPPAMENNRQFKRLAALFARHRVGVPRIFARDEDAGLFVLSDLGSRHLEDVYASGGAAAALPSALETLHRIQQISDPAVPDYTEQRFRDELGIFAEWFVEALLEQPFPADRLGSALERLIDNTREQVRCCVHRDFHCRNLLLADTGEIGVVDFQDALMGPAAYDLASLLRDCYHRFPEAEVARWRNAYLARTALPVNPGNFARELDLTAVQRQLKAVGIFARLHLRDGKDTHLPSIEPVLEQLDALCGRYAELTELGRFLRAIRPAARRRLEALSCGP